MERVVALRSFKSKLQPYLDNYGDDPSCAVTLILPSGPVRITATELYHVDDAILFTVANERTPDRECPHGVPSNSKGLIYACDECEPR